MTKEQKEDYQMRMERAGAYEDLIKHKGFEYIKNYYTTLVQVLTNRLLQGNEDLSKIETERQQVIGIKGLLGHLQSDIDFLNNERKKGNTTTK